MSGLPVFYEDRRVGEVLPEEGLPFVYDQDWLAAGDAFAISTTMPLRMREIRSGAFLAWAANLLPEADQLALVGRRLGIAQGDVLGMLAAIGRDTAGALSFGAPGRVTETEWKPIDGEADLERIIEELPRKPFLAGEDGVSMSLAGVQTKLAVSQDAAGALYIPLEGAPSTHILKPDSDRLVGSVQNEAFCLTLARLCGLAVPAVTTGRAGDRRYFLIERYDRRRAGNAWMRRHQEDFCQALGRFPAEKYERNGTGSGPTIVDMVGVLRRHGLAPDTLAIIDLVTFNILACNTDAHAKNYSLLVGRDRARLAPLYDVLCASPYAGITRNLAQTVAGKNRGEHIKRRHWLRMFGAANLNPKLMLRRVDRLANSVLANLYAARAEVEAMPAGGDVILPTVAEAIGRRSRAILDGLEDMRDHEDEIN